MRTFGCAFLTLSGILALTTAIIPGCDYFDTIDLSNSTKLENDSYQYGNILIPADKTAVYNVQKQLDVESKKISQVIANSNYTRGCACHVKSCVLFCCVPPKSLVELFLNITLNNGTEVELNVLKELVVQPMFNQDCDQFNVNDNVDDKWTLFESGVMFSNDAEVNLHKSDYCLVPKQVKGNDFKLVPFYIDNSEETVTSKITVTDALRVVSVFCMLVTIFAHLYLRQFTTYDICCICYFFCLTISFTLLWVDSLIRNNKMPKKWVCYLIGYAGYYTVIATFLWLLLINFSLWRRVHKGDSPSRSSLKKYNFFVWGTASLFLGATGLAEFLLSPKDKNGDTHPWAPAVTVYTCWINTEDWSAMIYYFGPILLAILINTWLSLVTARVIYNRNKKICVDFSKFECSTNQKNQANFGMFFRLFAITGVAWLLEIISYMCNFQNVILDTITASQGILLFFVTMTGHEILKSLYQRIVSSNKQKQQQRERQRQPLTTTTSTTTH